MRTMSMLDFNKTKFYKTEIDIKSLIYDIKEMIEEIINQWKAIFPRFP